MLKSTTKNIAGEKVIDSGPQHHKTITDYLFLLVSYDKLSIKHQGGNKTAHRGPYLAISLFTL